MTLFCVPGGNLFRAGPFPPIMELPLSSRKFAAPARRAYAVPVRLLLLGAFATLLALMTEQRLLTSYPVPPSMPAALRPVMAPPSVVSPVLQAELAMSPQQLLDRWDPLVQEAARKFHVPAAWLWAVMRRESAGRTVLADGKPIVSAAGALGIMQLMPGTYQEMAAQYRLGNDPFDPHDNIFAAAGYLRWLKGKYGFPAMFAAYNDGPGNYEDHLHGRALPAETKNYLKAIAGELGVAVADSASPLEFTRPDGSKVAIDAAKVSAVRAVLPGEYDASVHSVISIGPLRQGVQEDPVLVEQRLRKNGMRA
jgi:soluble lytic murein transglycosylase-like protein